MAFDNKITVMVHSNGRIARVYSVGLTLQVTDHQYEQDDDLMPLTHLNASSLLGGAKDDDIQGKLYCTQIASLISRQAPEESRTVVIGLGPGVGLIGDEVTESDRMQFLEIIRLVQESRVW
jgi:hypothetical protein